MKNANELLSKLRHDKHITNDEYKMLLFSVSCAKNITEIKNKVIDLRNAEAKNHDTFDEYSDGRYDMACAVLRILDGYKMM